MKKDDHQLSRCLFFPTKKQGLYCCCWSVELELKKALHQFWKLRCLQNRERNNSPRLGFENKLVAFSIHFGDCKMSNWGANALQCLHQRWASSIALRKLSHWGFGFDCWRWFLNQFFLLVKCVLPVESHPSLGTWRCWASCRRRILVPTPWNCPTTTSPCRSWWGRWWFHVNMLTLWVFQKCEFATFGLELDVSGLWCVMLLFACRRSVGVTSHRRLLLCKQGSSKMLCFQCVMLTCWGNPKDSQIKFSPC